MKKEEEEEEEGKKGKKGRKGRKKMKKRSERKRIYINGKAGETLGKKPKKVKGGEC